MGERLPSPFGEGETTLWFHPACAAYKRPAPFLEATKATTEVLLDELPRLQAAAELGIAHRRLPRLDGVERAPTGRARCRACRELIEKDVWRIRLVFYEQGRFEPSGFVHLGCARAYFETADLLDRLRHFSPGLNNDDLAELRAALD